MCSMNDAYMPRKVMAKKKYVNATGETVPSVTTALAIIDKPALVGWANKMGLNGIDTNKYKNELADVGTLAHYFIMCRLSEELPDFSENSPKQVDAAMKCYAKFTDWETRNPLKPILTEHEMVSEQYQYGGCIDLYCLSSGQLMLCDFKTGSGIFPEMIYQVAAYRQLLRESGFIVSKVIILRIGRDDSEGAEEKILSSSQLDVGFEIFIHALAIHKLTKGK